MHRVLRGIAGSDFAGLQAEQREAIRQAAAEIEGHDEAFAVVVADRAGTSQRLEQAQNNHRHTLDFLARWRELLVALHAEMPNDIRIKRALMGEHPMRPAAWEKQQ
ncbi:hypothetical protein [Paraburkholderia sp. BL23I1N1]|uniref:hypothetical protein n=1 Tax=Paraburkholderia sp. BL23I1N1 TaxID=1938802 RepID=UPI0011C404CF|nr:hypothetical protein [Paraburkholderia sp. BL23I1N1]